MNGKKRITISDVARKAGVSIATVSRVMNGADYPVNDNLRKAVLEAAEALHYAPNLFGRSLKSGKSSDVGVIVPSLVNPFFSEVISGMERRFRAEGYNPIFCSSGHEPEKELELIALMREKCVEGLLISTIHADSGLLHRLMDEDASIVLFDQPIPGFRGDSVSFDFVRAGRIAAQYLVRMGHREIAFLCAPFNRFSRRAIFRGFRESLAEQGAPFRRKNLVVSPDEGKMGETGIREFENGRRLAKMFLASGSGATAAAVFNDITALGVVRELLQNGVRVPDDVSVMGFDNIGFSAMTTPALTTINHLSFRMGALAADVLVDRIRGKAGAPVDILLKPELVERDSVKSVGEKREN